jgi:molybdopterin converting factor small subunit
MQAKFYANMRTIIGIPSLDVDDARVDTFRKLTAYIIEKFPEAKPHLLDLHDNLRQDVPVYVDGRNPRLLTAGIDTPLKPDSVVSFFSPISSGRMNVEVLREPNFRDHSAQGGVPAAEDDGESRTKRSNE